MTPEELESIRMQMGLGTQQEMAELLQCDYVGYKRWATGVRDVPRYIGRSAQMLLFIFRSGRLNEFKKQVTDVGDVLR